MRYTAQFFFELFLESNYHRYVDGDMNTEYMEWGKPTSL